MDDIEVGTFEAKNKLSSLVQMASKGKKIWITRRGQRVALLSSGIHALPGNNKSLMNSFREIRARAATGKGTLKSLIEEGRK